MTTDRLYEAIVASIVQRGGSNAVELAREEVTARWVQTGILEATNRLGIDVDDAAASMVYGAAFASGALAALNFARAVLSDPIVRGMEGEALKMIEAGASHADIVASLKRHRSTTEEQVKGNVIAFPADRQ